jgi:membrane protease YdiL (CAAX protease family)
MPESAALRGLLVLVAAILASALIVFVLAPLFTLPQAESPIGIALSISGATVLLYGSIIAVAAIGLWLGGEGKRLAGMRPERWFACGLGLGVGGLLVAALYGRIAGTVQVSAQPAIGTWMMILLGTFTVLFQSAAEELFFRGWLQRSLRRTWGVWPALAASTLTFGLLHLLGGERALLALVNISLAGLLFGLLAECSGGIAAPIGAHFAWNWAEQILLGLDPNPGIGPFGAITDFDMIGSPLWGGSSDGLNGSLAVTFTLIALAIPAAVWSRSIKQSPAYG